MIEVGQPRLPVGLVRRERIHDRLAAAPDVRLLLVTAPAGYGKTTTLAQWAIDDPRPCAWLQLEPAHDDPTVLVRDTIRALGAIGPLPPELPDALASPTADLVADVLPRLGTELRAWDVPVVLVLDDAHQLAGAGAVAVAAVDLLVDHLPAGSVVALAAREAPPVALGRRRVRRQLVELHAGDLAMDADETSALLEAEGLVPPPDAVADLVRRTEGWPAGIYLAAIAARNARDA